MHAPFDASPAGLRPCEHPGCAEQGVYRAPYSRENLRQYRWFCLDHVRAYNARWNYCDGMSRQQIDAQIRADTVWGRPTWRLGSGPGRTAEETIVDPLGLRKGRRGAAARRRRAAAHGFAPGSPEAEACAVLQLDGPLTLDALKSRYRNLVKLNHPDTNGGSKAAEERLKTINRAYSVLRRVLAPKTEPSGSV